MPKEIIRDPNGPFAMEVRWGDSGTIQVATVVNPRTSDEPQNLFDLVNSWTDDSKEFATGLFVTLGWHECNRVIKDVRRARKQTHGEE